MADIAVQTVTRNTGAAVTYAAASAGGDKIQAFTIDHELIVKNGSGAPINVTISSHVNCDQGVDHDAVIAVAAGAELHWQGSPASRWRNTSTNALDIAYSLETSITVAALLHV